MNATSTLRTLFTAAGIRYRLCEKGPVRVYRGMFSSFPSSDEMQVSGVIFERSESVRWKELRGSNKTRRATRKECTHQGNFVAEQKTCSAR
jgi:hypothetical protein